MLPKLRVPVKNGSVETTLTSGAEAAVTVKWIEKNIFKKK